MKNIISDLNLSVFWQFVKYGICGAIGFVTMIAVVALFHFGFPDFVDDELHSSGVLLRNTNIVNTLAFIPSSIVAYFLNRAFVFETGRHNFWMEFGSFMVIALIPFFAGMAGTFFIMNNFEVSSIIGTIAFTIPALLVNFICRKYLVFKN